MPKRMGLHTPVSPTVTSPAVGTPRTSSLGILRPCRCGRKPNNTLPPAAAAAAAAAAQSQQPFTTAATGGRRRVQPADDPNFTSIVDNAPRLVRAGGRRHGWGLLVLAAIPVTAFFLGTWQVKRLQWKTDLLSRLEDRIARPPLPLPANVDPEMVADFDYRRVYAVGRLRHDEEMLVGPRIHDGEDGYLVVTPLERPGREEEGGAGAPKTQKGDHREEGGKGWFSWPWGSGSGSSSSKAGRQAAEDDLPPAQKGNTVLVNRGWVAKKFKDRRTRPQSVEQGDVLVEGLLREPWKKNRFTPDNRPDLNEFYFPDVKQMAQLTGATPVWVEETTEPDMLEFMEKKANGIPIARAAAVDVRNNHAQYIFTWYGLCLATSIMFYLVVKKPPTDTARRVKLNRNW
ncbi:Cytochrome oxidase assembly protein shy1 [Zalerion maritima]|uniref:SURF1-like protein n=1 Tax=Zalerion maritima TaxID=339359 RepID=A0AAD5RJ40_9PEZI|nr:Cytochrome oxidase assembly protein shy1 [Zalerion maritima]